MILADFTDPKNPKIQIKSSRQILKEARMTQLEGLKNFSVNIKSVMLKIRDAREGFKDVRLTASEQSRILQFYLEVVDYLSKEVK